MLKNYIRLAFKVMLRKKYYTFLALAGISFTIMITTMAAAFIDQLVGVNSSEPYRNRTLIIKEISPFTKGGYGFGSGPSLDFIKRYIVSLKSPEKIAFYRDGSYVSVQHNSARSHRLKSSDENFWSITDFEFTEGRSFTYNEVRNSSPVAVITEELKDYYFNDKTAVGKSILMYGHEFKVIGVVKNAPIMSNASSDAWIPYTANPNPVREDYSEDFWGPYTVMLLAHSTDDIQAVRREIDIQVKKIVPRNAKIDSVKASAQTPLQQFAQIRRGSDEGVGPILGVLTVFLILFLLIPVISLVNLNISRMAERAAEIGIRKSFGASSGTLTGQFIVENIILTLTGGMIGVGLAFGASDVLIHILNTFDPLYEMESGQFILSWRVFAFCVGCCLLFGFMAGVYPAYRMSRLHPVNALKGDNL